MRYVIIVGFLLAIAGMAGFDLFIKKSATAKPKTHFELMMGEVVASCKKSFGNDNGFHLSECIAIVNGFPMPIPDIRAAVNVMEFPDQPEQQ